MASLPFLTAGRVLLSFNAFATSTGCFIADWNETHVKNSKWPPHALFHNGQSMSMGLILGLLTAYFTWRSVPMLSGSGADGLVGVDAAKDSLFTAALLGSVYYIAGLSGILYPGAAWVDPGFDHAAGQPYAFSLLALIGWAGYGLEMRRLDALKMD